MSYIIYISFYICLQILMTLDRNKVFIFLGQFPLELIQGGGQ